MIRSALLVLCVTLAACSNGQPAAVDKVTSDVAELHMAVTAMENHPSLQEGQVGAAGKPISVPTTVKPRPPGVTLAPHRHGPPAPKHKH